MSSQYFIVELTDIPVADETRIEVENGTNYAVGVLEDSVIKLVDYSYRSPSIRGKALSRTKYPCRCRSIAMLTRL